MRALVIGAGAVGRAIAVAAAEGDTLEPVLTADVDPARADRVLDASDAADVEALLRAERIDVCVNACDPRLNPAIFAAAFAAGCHYVDLAMSLSAPGKLLGADQLAAHDAWEARGLLALVGMGVEPGLADVFARYAADHLFAEIDEIGVRDGGDMVVDGLAWAPTFSIWTTIEECLNPPIVWERDRGWFLLEPFAEPETFVFPDGIGPVECVHVEHEEVVLVPRWVDCRRVTFKYGLGAELIDVLQVLAKTGLASTRPVEVSGVEVAPRDVVAAVLPDPAGLGDRMHGRTCAGTWVTGTGTDGAPRSSYLYHVADNAETLARHGIQGVAWQTAVNTAVALDLFAAGVWEGAGVLGPEAFDAVPFLDRLRARGEPWHVEDRL
jgi:saccharopine dehydrogenase-like NADP-dependent oxidoreductase